MLLGGAGATTPQRQEALPYLCDWEHGAGGWENTKTATAKQGAAGPNPRWMRKKEKRKRSADGPDPEKDIGDFRPNYRKPHSYPCRRQGNGAKPATWAATLAPSQAGANIEVRTGNHNGSQRKAGLIQQPWQKESSQLSTRVRKLARQYSKTRSALLHSGMSSRANKSHI